MSNFQIPPDHNQFTPYGAPATHPSAMHQPQNQVSAIAIDMLRRTKSWVRLISVLGFISVAMMLLAAFALMVGVSALSQDISGIGVGAAFLGVFYLIFSFIYLYPLIRLTQFANSISRLVASQTSIDLETTLNHQRAFWKYCGVLALIMLILFSMNIVLAIFGEMM